MSVTIRQLASELGLSHMTVSRVMRGEGPIAANTRKRVLDAARKMGYRPNAAARAMSSRRTRQVGVLVPNHPGNRFAHPLAYETILGINEGLQQAGYVMCLARIDDVRRDLAEQSRVFKEHLLDGMIVLDSMPADVEQKLESLIPDVVWCDSNVWREHGCVRRDERQAGRLAGEAAVAAGYRRVMMMTYAPEHREHFSSAERFEGVSDAVATAGKKLEVITEPSLSKPAERRDLAALLTPDAVVICNSVYQAHATRSAAEAAGKIAGRDFGLASCDDMHQLDRLWPGLARVSFHRYGMGLEAARMMTAALDDREPLASRLFPGAWLAGNTLASLV